MVCWLGNNLSGQTKRGVLKSDSGVAFQSADFVPAGVGMAFQVTHHVHLDSLTTVI